MSPHSVGPAGVPPCATTPSITAAVVCLRIIKDGGAWKVNDKTVCWTRVLFQSLARSFCPSRQLRFRRFSSLNYGETNTAALCNIPSAVSNESRGRGFTSSCKTFGPACLLRASRGRPAARVSVYNPRLNSTREARFTPTGFS